MLTISNWLTIFTGCPQVTEPQEAACGAMVGRRCRWPSGRMLGGSSGLNYMLWVRGQREDYDTWAEETGDPGWGWDQLQPYFQRAEAELAGAPRHTSALTEDILAAARSHNYTVSGGEHGRGFMVPRVTQRDGARADTYRTYLRRAAARPNLAVLKNARVLRVLVEGGAAVGVEFSRYGAEQRLRVRAGGEVVLSAGTVSSAHLLLVSGLGPAEQLRRHGVPLVADLPGVGRNLQDHLTTNLGPFLLNNSHTSFHPATSLGLGAVWDYLVHGAGPLTSVGVDAMGFIQSQESAEAEARPDTQLLFMSSWLLADYWSLVWRTFGLDGERLWAGYYRHLYTPRSLHAVSILPVLLRPRSRGEVSLRSADPWAPPRVDPRYLSHPADLATLVAGTRRALALVSGSPQLRRHGYTLPQLATPGCEHTQLFSAAYWACHVSQLSLTMYHPVIVTLTYNVLIIFINYFKYSKNYP